MRVYKIWIEDLPDKICLSKARRKKYFKEGQKIPKKYDNDKFGFIKGILCNLLTKEKIVKNPKAQGTALYTTLNSQNLWNNKFNKFTRAKIKRDLEIFFIQFIKDLEQVKKCSIVYTLFSNKVNFDLGNKSFMYQKAFEDVLVKSNIIRDDNVTFLSSFTWNYVKHELDKDSLLIEISVIE